MYDSSSFNSDVNINNNLTVGSSTTSGNLDVFGNTTLHGSLDVLNSTIQTIQASTIIIVINKILNYRTIYNFL